MRVDCPGSTGGGVPSSPIHGAAFAATVRSVPSYRRSMPNAWQSFAGPLQSAVSGRMPPRAVRIAPTPAIGASARKSTAVPSPCSPHTAFAHQCMHLPIEIGIDSFQADRAPDRRYRTSPLKGLWTHQKGGFYHDGRFATLLDVVNHYNTLFSLGLTEGQKNDLVEYLKSL